MKARTRAAGHTTVGLALAATTVAAMTVPAAGQPVAGQSATVGATALTLSSAVPAPTQAPTAMTYRVQGGDTVSHIALRTGTSIAAIVRTNNLDSRARIRAGQMLRIPVPDSTSTAPPAPTERAAQIHTVAAGDTVSALAKRYGTSVSAMISANDLNSRALIIVGQQLTIPGAADESASSGRDSSPTSSSSGTTHEVRAGDTVSALAHRYGTTVSAIGAANDLGAQSVIYVGQQLTIPAGTSSSAESSSGELVGDTFLGRTYASSVVSAANTNKASLNAMGVPSRATMQQMVRDTAVQMGVDPSLAQAVAQQESGFDARAVSPANAVGVMQVIPSSGEWASQLVGRELNLLDPRDNVVAGVAILRQLQRAAPDLDTAIAGYYQGLAGVTRNGMYPDTRNYVAGIRNLMQRF